MSSFDSKPAYNTYRYSVEEFNFGYHDFMFSYYTLYRGDNRNIVSDTGIDYWANRFKEGLEISTFLELYMEIDAGNFIEQNYLLLLDRSSDLSGKNYYLTQLQNGLTREWVIADIISSDSFLSLANNSNYNGNSSIENFIYHVYFKLLGRTPTNEEISQDYFTDISRNVRRSYILSFLNREEYLIRFVTEQYGIYLNRTPDIHGLEFYVTQWTYQKDFLIKLMLSNEFWRKSVIRGNCQRQ